MTDQSTELLSFPADASSPIQVVVVGSDFVRRVPIAPNDRDMVFGRSAEARVRIPDTTVSERHAELQLQAGALSIRDLGSTNGTWVGADRVHGVSHPVRLGQVIRLGTVLVIVQVAPPRRATIHVWNHHQFMARLEQECDSARQFAIVVVRAPAAPSAMVVLLRHLAGGDIAARLGPGHLELLLAESSPREAAVRTEGIREGMGPGAAAGVSCFPSDGSNAEQLVLAATDRLLDNQHPAALATDAVMIALHEQARKVAGAPLASDILIVGETGTGKEILSRFIHEHSLRARGPMRTLDCGTVTPTLAASELFGSQKGSHSTALSDQMGLFQAADKGTVVLDEIHNLPFDVQAQLLRVLDQREVSPVGPRGQAPVKVDVRVIATTNRNLEIEVKEGRFRNDLYYRLAMFTLEIPPLRRRPGDIVRLAREFLATASHSMGKSLALSDEAVAALEEFDWPGNVRQLKTIIYRAAVLKPGPLLGPEDLDLPQTSDDAAERATDGRVDVDLDTLSSDEARRVIIQILIDCGCVKERAAKRFGISKGTLLAKMKTLGLPVPRAKRPGKPPPI